MNRGYCAHMTTELEWQAIAEQEIARPVACEILHTCACTRDSGFLGVAGELGHETDGLAALLASAAWELCANELGWEPGSADDDLYYRICAEAESLLQCGWFPGEPSDLY